MRKKPLKGNDMSFWQVYIGIVVVTTIIDLFYTLASTGPKYTDYHNATMWRRFWVAMFLRPIVVFIVAVIVKGIYLVVSA